MGYLHLLLCAVFLIPYFLLGFLYSVILWIIGRKDPDRKRTLSCRYLSIAAKGVLFLSGIKVTVIGRERVPEGTAILYTANHRSMFDAVVALKCFPDTFAPIAKLSLLKVPVLGWWMKKAGCLFLDREDIRKGAQMVNDAVDDIKKGVSVLIFPEGTRNREEGTLLPFHGGSFKIAIRSGAPVVPVTIVNTGEIFEGHIPSIWSRHVIVEFGEPIYTEKMPVPERKALPDRVRHVMQETYERNVKLI